VADAPLRGDSSKRLLWKGLRVSVSGQPGQREEGLIPENHLPRVVRPWRWSCQFRRMKRFISLLAFLYMGVGLGAEVPSAARQIELAVLAAP
jgi:hypothetical protein